MSPLLVRTFVLPLVEAALGRDTFPIWRELESDTTPDPGKLARLRADRLARLLRHSAAVIPYWRDRLAGHVPDAPGADVLALLAPLPVLTRAEMRLRREAMRWAGAPGRVLVHRSGGTTDDNLTFYWNRLRQSWDRATRFRGLARFGVLPGDRALHLWPRYPDGTRFGRLKQRLRDWRDRVVNDEVVDLRPFTPARLDAALDYAAAYRPAVLIAYPSWLAHLAGHVRSARRGFRLPTLRAILSTGEVLFDFQRQAIGETFQAPLFQEYGSQDAGLIAHECPDRTFRVNAEQLVVEVLRDGRPAALGEFGEVVVTHFFTPVMPFIRYATGDVVRQPPSPPPGCPGLPHFPTPEGRTSDLLLAADGALCSSRPVVEALVARAGLRDFSLLQPDPETVVVLEATGDGGRPGSRADAEDVLRHFLGRPVGLDWRVGTRFEPFVSGKRRYVCSPAALRVLAHDQESGVSRSRAWPQRLVVDGPGVRPA
jgi:phenylacetate-CoA ligase